MIFDEYPSPHSVPARTNVSASTDATSAGTSLLPYSVNFQSAGYLAAWKKNNPKAFDEDKVSPTVENTLFNPTFLNFHR
jgi:hypothetical protein